MNSCAKNGGAERRRFYAICEKPEVGGGSVQTPPARRRLTKDRKRIHFLSVHFCVSINRRHKNEQTRNVFLFCLLLTIPTKVCDRNININIFFGNLLFEERSKDTKTSTHNFIQLYHATHISWWLEHRFKLLNSCCLYRFAIKLVPFSNSFGEK